MIIYLVREENGDAKNGSKKWISYIKTSNPYLINKIVKNNLKMCFKSHLHFLLDYAKI